MLSPRSSSRGVSWLGMGRAVATVLRGLLRCASLWVCAVGVAQLVRAPDCGSGGRGFETRHSPQPRAAGLFEQEYDDRWQQTSDSAGSFSPPSRSQYPLSGSIVSALSYSMLGVLLL